ncbi:MAG: Transcriptional regulator, IclR family, partial [uncultured Nocardioides sp.]
EPGTRSDPCAAGPAIPGRPGRPGAAGPGDARLRPAAQHGVPPAQHHDRRGLRGAPARRAPLRARGRGVRGGQRVHPPGAARPPRPPTARRAGGQDRARRPPGRAARSRRPLRRGGARARAATPGDRRGGAAAGPPHRVGTRDPLGTAGEPGAGALPGPLRLRRPARPGADVAERTARDPVGDAPVRSGHRGRGGDPGPAERRRAGARPQRPPGGGRRRHVPQRRGRRRAGLRGGDRHGPPAHPAARRGRTGTGPRHTFFAL